jgi:hypothetical protein
MEEQLNALGARIERVREEAKAPVPSESVSANGSIPVAAKLEQ